MGTSSSTRAWLAQAMAWRIQSSDVIELLYGRVRCANHGSRSESYVWRSATSDAAAMMRLKISRPRDSPIGLRFIVAKYQAPTAQRHARSERMKAMRARGWGSRYL